MTTGGLPSGVRKAELVAALSLATDLGLGLPEEHVLRQTVIARRLARLAGLSAAQQDAVFYTSLLAWVGCVADSHEMAHWFGDDRRLRAESYAVDKAGLPMLRFLVEQVGRDAGPARRLTAIGRFLVAGGVAEAMGSMITHCRTTADIAERLGLPDDIGRALGQAFERWDGRGVPGRLRAAAIDPVIRVVHVADDTEQHHRAGGVGAATAMLRSRRGTEFDPDLVDLVCAHADEVFDGLDAVSAWQSVLDDGSPAESPALTEDELTDALRVFGDYADLKAPCFLGHSAAVAALAADAAGRMGLPDADVTLVERAALVHDLGVHGVSSGVWDKPGPLSAGEWERVRMHPYLTERTLARVPQLAELGTLAALHHERLDGSGYPRGLRADAMPITARVLAAAVRYRTAVEPRPHRPAAEPAAAQTLLRADAAAGRLDGEAVNAVLAAAGHRVRRRPALPAGLSPREAQVLGLVARGLSNRAIAAELSLAPRTVGSHVEHVYTKIGVSTRGAAAMFAMRHGLVGDPVQG
ncbi:HD domain-containing phosphohydrolase [Pseudonocardia dioxanivorans]|uniref:HD domain-containing phosphohydrolase n=1 Tax=Pseudonocardia dioxanivorans TaxID=240495 RepID=UPI000CD2A5BC|nr:HD domain-containing phosphohydrolase [Pseudonocardia dioxanivorans]